MIQAVIFQELPVGAPWFFPCNDVTSDFIKLNFQTVLMVLCQAFTLFCLEIYIFFKMRLAYDFFCSYYTCHLLLRFFYNNNNYDDKPLQRAYYVPDYYESTLYVLTQSLSSLYEVGSIIIFILEMTIVMHNQLSNLPRQG